MAKAKNNNSPAPLAFTLENTLTKEQRAIKENGQIRTTQEPFIPPGIGKSHGATTFKERNDGWYAAFDEKGDRLHYSVGPKIIREITSLVV